MADTVAFGKKQEHNNSALAKAAEDGSISVIDRTC